MFLYNNETNEIFNLKHSDNVILKLNFNSTVYHFESGENTYTNNLSFNFNSETFSYFEEEDASNDISILNDIKIKKTSNIYLNVYPIIYSAFINSSNGNTYKINFYETRYSNLQNFDNFLRKEGFTYADSDIKNLADINLAMSTKLPIYLSSVYTDKNFSFKISELLFPIGADGKYKKSYDLLQTDENGISLLEEEIDILFDVLNVSTRHKTLFSIELCKNINDLVFRNTLKPKL